MQVYDVSKKLYDSLIKYETKTYNTEGELFIVPEKDKWTNKEVMLKRLFIDEGDYFGNKLYTVNSLISKSEDIGIEELVLPNKLAIYNDRIIGFTMELVNGMNLDELLSSNNFSLQFKKQLLIQIGQVLDKIKKVRQYNGVSDFFIGDLHEGNIVYNLETKGISFVDMDSCKINGNKPFPSKYLATNKNLRDFPFKYLPNTKSIKLSELLIDENTDYYCYAIIVLNYLLGKKAISLSVNEYYEYLEYLSTLGYNLDLLNALACIYTPKENENLFELLDSLPTDYKTLALSKYDIFKSKK